VQAIYDWSRTLNSTATGLGRGVLKAEHYVRELRLRVGVGFGYARRFYLQPSIKNQHLFVVSLGNKDFKNVYGRRFLTWQGFGGG